MINPLRNSFSKILNKKEKTVMSTEELIEYNKAKFNLSHGKGKRKKHKVKTKRKG
jgi:hypothetical protein